MEIKDYYYEMCNRSDCLAPADLEFTDVKKDNDNKYETITLGHACEFHFDEVKKTLEDGYGETK